MLQEAQMSPRMYPGVLQSAPECTRVARTSALPRSGVHASGLTRTPRRALLRMVPDEGFVRAGSSELQLARKVHSQGRSGVHASGLEQTPRRALPRVLPERGFARAGSSELDLSPKPHSRRLKSSLIERARAKPLSEGFARSEPSRV